MSLYNLRNPAVKRLMKEAEELLHPTDEYHAQPVEDNLFEWHFTLRGPPNSDYEGGIYHGRITLPPDYPMKPPSIILLTPNGRFETNKKICLSISGHHPESWQPSWSIRTALLAIIGFMPTHGNGALGSLDYTPEERKQLALKSQDFKCFECGYIKDIFQKTKPSDCPETSISQESLSDLEVNIESNQTNSTESLSSNTHTDSSFINPILEQLHYKDDENSLVHRHKSTLTQATNIEAKVISYEYDHNFLYSVFIFVLVAILVFLIFRRMFSV